MKFLTYAMLLAFVTTFALQAGSIGQAAKSAAKDEAIELGKQRLITRLES